MEGERREAADRSAPGWRATNVSELNVSLEDGPVALDLA